jgi:hypothetical protein
LHEQEIAMKLTKNIAVKAIIGSMLVALTLSTTHAQPVLYGGLGGRGVSGGPQASTNDGSLVIVSQTNGSTTVIGHPVGVARISGLVFGLDGTLFGGSAQSQAEAKTEVLIHSLLAGAGIVLLLALLLLAALRVKL